MSTRGVKSKKYTKPVPGIIKVTGEVPQDKLYKYMLNNPNLRVSPIVVPEQKYDPIDNDTSQRDSVFSPVNIPRQPVYRDRALSDMENARQNSSPLTVNEYLSNLDDRDVEYSKDEWGHHNKNFFGGSKNRNRNKKKRATRKKLRNKKRQTRRKKQQ